MSVTGESTADVRHFFRWRRTKPMALKLNEFTGSENHCYTAEPRTPAHDYTTQFRTARRANTVRSIPELYFHE